jgi:hypothetical protein
LVPIWREPESWIGTGLLGQRPGWELGPGRQVGEGLVHSGGDDDVALRGHVLLVCKGVWGFIWSFEVEIGDLIWEGFWFESCLRAFLHLLHAWCFSRTILDKGVLDGCCWALLWKTTSELLRRSWSSVYTILSEKRRMLGNDLSCNHSEAY